MIKYFYWKHRKTLMRKTPPSHSGLGNNCDEKILYIPPNFRI